MPLIAHRRVAQLLAGAAALSFVAAPARAGLLDSLFGKNVDASGAQATAGDKQRVWRIREFSGLVLVPREAGSNPNQSPVVVQAAALRRQLALLQFGPPDRLEALFGDDEAVEVAPPLAQALGRAGAGDDILLVSSSRRDAGILFPPTALTARIFVQDSAVQIIVHDARYKFYDTYRGTYQAPDFNYGSRTEKSAVSVNGAGLASPRADWISIPLSSLDGSSSVSPSSSPAVATPRAMPAAAAAAASVVAPPAVPPAPRAPLDPNGAQDIERRLETLKRLRDKNLISEDEYLQKRKEILQAL